MMDHAASSLIKDTTTAGFREDVMSESMRQPVLVDFWAPWCGPCKQLTPIIEKVVKEAKGKVKLVKMNIEEHPQIAGQLGVQSIPAVYAFSQGRPVDAFMGAVPESQIKEFIERLTGPSPEEMDAEALRVEANSLLETGDAVGAAELFATLLAENSEDPVALAGLVRAQIAIGNLVQARRILETASEELAKQAPIIAARASLDLAEQAEKLGDISGFLSALEANPLDHQARFDLALALNAGGKREEAAEELIRILKADRTWNDDGARKQLLQFFEAWGPMDDATRFGRRRLSTTLFS
jgi:putative thioredoxin